MTALKIIGILLLIFLLAGFLRVGAIVSFDDALRVRLRIGIFRMTLIPKKEKEKKSKPEEAQEEPKKTTKKKGHIGKKRSLPKPNFDELLDLTGTALSALGATARRACRRVRIDPLDVTVVFAGRDDPAGAAISYGAASAAMFTVMPRLEERFYISDPSLHLRIDFAADEMAVEGQAGVSLRVCDLFAILFTLIGPLFKWFLRFKKAHKHDAAPKKEDAAKPEANEETEDKIA